MGYVKAGGEDRTALRAGYCFGRGTLALKKGCLPRYMRSLLQTPDDVGMFWRYSASNNFLRCEFTEKHQKEFVDSFLCINA